MAGYWSTRRGRHRYIEATASGAILAHRTTSAIAIDEDDAAQTAPTIIALRAMVPETIGLGTSHLLVRQPKQDTHAQAPARPTDP